MTEKKYTRCAIYTRKSSDEGLEKEFNTLAVQREAGENYIKSQSCQGWVALSDHYDDGGYSGGTLERPALKRLIEDVKADKVDMIVVYKIDRLTRSLLDFSKLIEILDAHHCTFVSVTQNFNTYDSMGRLTLNVLLSFAQFERELDAERIRDKIAASRRKGLWIGGAIPLGYEVKDRKLIIVPEEAETIKIAFEQYLLLQSTKKVAHYLNSHNFVNKGRYDPVTKQKSIHTFNMRTVSNLLKNPIVAGKMTYKGEIYEGQHEGIIDYELFQKVQELRKKNRNECFRGCYKHREPLLKGLLECGECHCSLVRIYSKRNNISYEYYASSNKLDGAHDCDIRNIPVGELNTFVIKRIQKIVRSPRVLDELTRQVGKRMPYVGISEILEQLSDPGKLFDKLPEVAIRRILNLIIKKIYVYSDHLSIKLTADGTSLFKTARGQIMIDDVENLDEQEISCRVNFHRQHGSIKLEVPCGMGQVDDVLLQAISNALKWQHIIETTGCSVQELATKEKKDRRYMAKLLSLTQLAPDIIEHVVRGTQPETLTLSKLTRYPIPVSWVEQRKFYGIA